MGAVTAARAAWRMVSDAVTVGRGGNGFNRMVSFLGAESLGPSVTTGRGPTGLTGKDTTGLCGVSGFDSAIKGFLPFSM
jgi:hypothetical protein